MNTFTKTLIASAMAFAVAGPAASDVKENGAFVGTKTKVKVSPSGCKSSSDTVPQTTLGFEDDSSYPESGYWTMVGYNLGMDTDIEGQYIERKVGKDLTASLYSGDLGACFPAGTTNAEFCDGIVGEIQDYLVDESCGFMSLSQSQDFSVTKGSVKISKNGDRAKIDFKVEGEYTNTKGNTDKDKKVNATIKGSMDFDSSVANPAD